MGLMIAFLIPIVFRLSDSFGIYFNQNTVPVQKHGVAPVIKRGTSRKRGLTAVPCFLSRAEVPEMASRELRAAVAFSSLFPHNCRVS